MQLLTCRREGCLSFCSYRIAPLFLIFFITSLNNPGSCFATEAPLEKGTISILSKEQEEKLNKESKQGDDIPYVDRTTEDKLDQWQQRGSQYVIGAARWIDSFFNDPRYIAEENRTRVRISLKFGYDRFDDFEVKPGLRLRLRLPGLENRAKFYLTAGADDFDVDSNPIAETENDREEDLTAGIKYFLKQTEKYNLATGVGASTSYVYAGVRFRHLHSLSSKTWKGRFTNRLRYYSDDGWENKAAYDIERYLGDTFFFRTTFTGVLQEVDDNIPLSAVARLYQVLDIDRALQYDVGSYFNTDPDFEVDDIQLTVRYRQRFYRDWLVLEIAPQLTFPSAYDYDINPGITFKFEADLGYEDYENAYKSIFRF